MIKKIKLFSEIAREIILISRDRDGESDARFRDVLSFYETRKPFLSDQSDTSCATFHAVQPILIKYSRLIRSIITENRCLFPPFPLFFSFFSLSLSSSSFFPSNAQFFFYNEVLTSMNVVFEEGVKRLTKLKRTSDNFQVLRTGRNRFPLVNHAEANLSAV